MVQPTWTAFFYFILKPLLQNIKRDVANWQQGTFTWFGHNSILNMNVMPRLKYLFQKLPISLCSSFLKDLQATFLVFFWAKKRISFHILSSSKHRIGGDQLLWPSKIFTTPLIRLEYWIGTFLIPSHESFSPGSKNLAFLGTRHSFN